MNFTAVSGGGGGGMRDPRKTTEAAKGESLGHGDKPDFFTVRGYFLLPIVHTQFPPRWCCLSCSIVWFMVHSFFLNPDLMCAPHFCLGGLARDLPLSVCVSIDLFHS